MSHNSKELIDDYLDSLQVDQDFQKVFRQFLLGLGYSKVEEQKKVSIWTKFKHDICNGKLQAITLVFLRDFFSSIASSDHAHIIEEILRKYDGKQSLDVRGAPAVQTPRKAATGARGAEQATGGDAATPRKPPSRDRPYDAQRNKRETERRQQGGQIEQGGRRPSEEQRPLQQKIPREQDQMSYTDQQRQHMKHDLEPTDQLKVHLQQTGLQQEPARPPPHVTTAVCDARDVARDDGRGETGGFIPTGARCDHQASGSVSKPAARDDLTRSQQLRATESQLADTRGGPQFSKDMLRILVEQRPIDLQKNQVFDLKVCRGFKEFWDAKQELHNLHFDLTIRHKYAKDIDEQKSKLMGERIDRNAEFQRLDDPNRPERLIRFYEDLEVKYKDRITQKFDDDEEFEHDRRACQILMDCNDWARKLRDIVMSKTIDAVNSSLLPGDRSKKTTENLNAELWTELSMAMRVLNLAKPSHAIAEKTKATQLNAAILKDWRKNKVPDVAVNEFIQESARLTLLMSLQRPSMVLEAHCDRSRECLIPYNRDQQRLLPTCKVKVKQVNAIEYFTWPTLWIAREEAKNPRADREDRQPSVAVKAYVMGGRNKKGSV